MNIFEVYVSVLVIDDEVFLERQRFRLGVYKGDDEGDVIEQAYALHPTLKPYDLAAEPILA